MLIIFYSHLLRRCQKAGVQCSLASASARSHGSMSVSKSNFSVKASQLYSEDKHKENNKARHHVCQKNYFLDMRLSGQRPNTITSFLPTKRRINPLELAHQRATGLHNIATRWHHSRAPTDRSSETCRPATHLKENLTYTRGTLSLSSHVRQSPFL